MEDGLPTGIIPTPSELAGVSSALLPPEEGGPDPVRMGYLAHSYLRQAPRAVRAATKLGIASLEILSRLKHQRGLRSLDPATRARLVEQLDEHPVTAQALRGLKALLLLSYGAERHRGEIFTTAGSHPPVRADPELNVLSSGRAPSRLTADAVVVGSGAGGAVAALRLAQKGMSVVVLEEGRSHNVEEFRRAHPLARFASLYRDAGTTVALGSPPIALPLGRGIGGTTLVNSGTCYRTPEDVLDRWVSRHRLEIADRSQLAPHFEEVERMLGVEPAPMDVMGRNGKLVLEGARKLGLGGAPLLRNAPGCKGSCQCAIGCPNNAKAGVHLSVLPEACAQGATIVSEARAERVLVESGRAVGVLASRPDGSQFRIESPRVVVAAGAVETPPLLRRSGLGKHPKLGKNLTIHPAFAVIGLFEEEVVPWRGVLQSVGIDTYHKERGILMEATSAPPGMSSAMLPGWGGELVRQVESMTRTATLGAMIADRPQGVVHGKSRPVVTYRLHKDDARRIAWGIVECARVLEAAGARGFIAPVAGMAPVESVKALEDELADLDFRRLHLAAFHPVGTAAAGGLPERHPTDGSGALRGAEGVWVCDASVLPECPTVNPQVTIMALASAIASRIK